MVNTGALGLVTALVSGANASYMSASTFSGGFLRRSTMSATGYSEGSFFSLISEATAQCPVKNDGIINFLFTDNPDIPHCVEIDTFVDQDGVTAAAKKSMFFSQGVYDYSSEALKLEDARVIVHAGCSVHIQYCNSVDNGHCDNAGELKQDQPGVYWLRGPPKTDRMDIFQVDPARTVASRYVTKIEVTEATSLAKCATLETHDLPSEKIKSFDLDFTTSRPVDFDSWTGDLGYSFGSIGVHALTVRPSCMLELNLVSPDQVDDDGEEAWRVFLSPGHYPSLRAYLHSKYPEQFGSVADLGNAVTVKGAQVHALVSVQVPGVVDVATQPRKIPLCMIHHAGAGGSSGSLGLKPCEDTMHKANWMWTPHQGLFRPVYNGEPLDQCLTLAGPDGVPFESPDCIKAAQCPVEGCKLAVTPCGNKIARKLGAKRGLPGVGEIRPSQLFSTPNLKCWEEGTHDLGSYVLALNALRMEVESVNDIPTALHSAALCVTAGEDTAKGADINEFSLLPTTNDVLRVKVCGSVAQATSPNCGVARRQLFRIARGYAMPKYATANKVKEVKTEEL